MSQICGQCSQQWELCLHWLWWCAMMGMQITSLYQTTAMSEVLQRHNLDEIELKSLNSHKIISWSLKESF